MASRESRDTPAFIPLSEPHLGGREWDYLKECLDTGWVSSAGKFVDEFESQFAETIGVTHAVSAVNGTSALHVALLAAGVREGDEVLTSALTFIAPANAVRYAGAWPVFVDADPATWQMDAGLTADFLTKLYATLSEASANIKTFAPALFFILAAIAYGNLALAADQSRREAEIAETKAEAKQRRRERPRTSGERPANEVKSGERSPDLDELLDQIREQSNGRPLSPGDVQELAGLGRTKAFDLLRYGRDSGQVEQVGRGAYEFVNGREK